MRGQVIDPVKLKGYSEFVFNPDSAVEK